MKCSWFQFGHMLKGCFKKLLPTVLSYNETSVAYRWMEVRFITDVETFYLECYEISWKPLEMGVWNDHGKPKDVRSDEIESMHRHLEVSRWGIKMPALVRGPLLNRLLSSPGATCGDQWAHCAGFRSASLSHASHLFFSALSSPMRCDLFILPALIQTLKHCKCPKDWIQI